MKEELIAIENGRIEKNGNSILKGLYLHIFKNEIFGIIFDSVVERKCLLEYFKGNCSLCGGKLYLEGNKVDLPENETYFRSNYTIIEKSSKLVSSLHIEENVFLFADKRSTVRKKKYQREIQRLVEQFHLNLSLNKPVQKLSAWERVIIELIKAFVENKKMVVLTHISGFLKRNELEDVYDLLLQLQKYGMSFVLIEPFESIVFEWTNQLAIIQHGKTIGIFDSKIADRQLIYSAIIRERKLKRYSNISRIELTQENRNAPVLEFNHVETNGLYDLHLSVESGEVFKIYYMDDESCEQIIDLLKGNIKPLSGEIRLSNENYRVNNINQAVKKGICFIEESPYENMLFYNLNVRDNLSLALSNKVPLFWLRGRFLKSVDHIIKSFCSEDISGIKLRKLEPRILQQIAYYKWYLYAPKVVICIKPFTETDISLQEITIEMISILKSRGISVIILTSNFSELHKVEGDTVYIKNGLMIDEDEVYQTLYKK